jgi:hypothetical protein
LEKLMLPAPALAVTEPPQLFTTLGVLATTRLPGTVPTFAGRLSVKLASIGTTFALVTLKVIVFGVLVLTIFVPPKLLLIDGGCKITMPVLAVPPLQVDSPEGAV